MPGQKDRGTPPQSRPHAPPMRLDLLLCRLRFAGSRTLARDWIEQGHMRRNGTRVLHRDTPVSVGDVLTLPLHRAVRVIEILTLPARRGPPQEARTCYRTIDAGGTMAIAEAEPRHTKGTAQP